MLTALFADQGICYTCGTAPVLSDASCAILIDGIFKHMHKLAVRGLALQRRSWLINRMQACHEGILQQEHEGVVEEVAPISSEPTWVRDGAGQIAAQSVMHNLRESCAVEQRNEEFVPGVRTVLGVHVSCSSEGHKVLVKCSRAG
jgi:hypothetical protein